MKQITRINHVGLRVRNLDTAREFYEKLGLEFIVGPIGPEPVAVIEHPSGININFILNASEDASDKNLLMDVPEKHTGYTHIALEITDRGEVERHLTAAGILITETVTQPDGTVFFFAIIPFRHVTTLPILKSRRERTWPRHLRFTSFFSGFQTTIAVWITL